MVRSACPISVSAVKIPGAGLVRREYRSREIVAYRTKTMHWNHGTTVKKRGSGPGTRPDGLGVRDRLCNRVGDHQVRGLRYRTSEAETVVRKGREYEYVVAGPKWGEGNWNFGPDGS